MPLLRASIVDMLSNLLDSLASVVGMLENSVLGNRKMRRWIDTWQVGLQENAMNRD